jgi:putative ABC transport system permease protein
LGADRINALVLGVPLAIGAGRLISAQLYGLSSLDPLALDIAAAALAISAFFAAVIPHAVQHPFRE